MLIYEVGGSVRNQYIKLFHNIDITTSDRDYVVVNSTVEEMLSLGFKQVGKDFPVFLHPQTGEEYALARKEVKTGYSHTDFSFDFNSNITLEDDLIRRDFTMNAIAEGKDELTFDIYTFDFFKGIDDIKNKIIRHINTEHFQEDPLRVLRACRFAAQLDFTIANETMDLLKDMVKRGAFYNLTKERIVLEFKKAFAPGCNTSKFIRYMLECGALRVILSEIELLNEIKGRFEFHQEGTVFEHTMMVLDEARNMSTEVKIACLFHDVGKGALKEGEYGHDSEDIANYIINRLVELKFSNEWLNNIYIGIRYHMKLKYLNEMTPKKIHDILDKITNHFQIESNLRNVLDLMLCDNQGRIADNKDADNDKQIYDKWLKLFYVCYNSPFSTIPNYMDIPVDKRKYEERINRINKIRNYLKSN